MNRCACKQVCVFVYVYVTSTKTVLTIQCEPRRLRLESGFKKVYRSRLLLHYLLFLELTCRENETKIKLQPCKMNIFSGEFQSNSVIRAGTVGSSD